jgi:AcrR family transcriptional regulator
MAAFPSPIMARTPSKASHQAILTAFVKLIECQRIEDITTEDIAQAAGASKSTLYKHWADKDELLIEVIEQLVSTMPAADSGNFQNDAVQVLRNMFVEDKKGPFARIWSKLFAYTVGRPDFCAAVNQGLIKHTPKQTLVAIIRAAVEAGEFSAQLDVEFALDLLAGPLLHHRFLHGRVPPEMPAQVVTAIWPVLKAQSRLNN